MGQSVIVIFASRDNCHVNRLLPSAQPLVYMTPIPEVIDASVEGEITRLCGPRRRPRSGSREAEDDDAARRVADDVSCSPPHRTPPSEGRDGRTAALRIFKGIRSGGGGGRMTDRVDRARRLAGHETRGSVGRSVGRRLKCINHSPPLSLRLSSA